MSTQPTPTEIRESAEAARSLGLTDEEMVTTPMKGEEQRGVAIDWIIEKFADHALVSIIFEREDDDGYNVFNVCYNKKSKVE